MYLSWGSIIMICSISSNFAIFFDTDAIPPL